jgi:hypothetical protein
VLSSSFCNKKIREQKYENTLFSFGDGIRGGGRKDQGREVTAYLRIDKNILISV